MKIINTSNFHQHSRHFHHHRAIAARLARFEQSSRRFALSVAFFESMKKVGEMFGGAKKKS